MNTDNDTGIKIPTRPRKTLNQKRNSELKPQVSIKEPENKGIIESQIQQKDEYIKTKEVPFGFENNQHQDMQVKGDNKIITVQDLCLSTEPKISILEPKLNFDKTYVIELQITKMNNKDSNIIGFGILTNKYIFAKQEFEFNGVNEKLGHGTYIIFNDKTIYSDTDPDLNNQKKSTITFKEGDTIKLTVNLGKFIKFQNGTQEFKLECEGKDDHTNPFYICAVLKEELDEIKLISANETKEDNFIGKSTVYEIQNNKVQLEECFVKLKNLFITQRIHVFQELEKKRQNMVFTIRPQQGVDEEKTDILKAKRAKAWRGAIKQSDFFAVLLKYEFKNFTNEIIIQLLSILLCYNKHTKYVDYVRIYQAILTKESKFSLNTKKFMSKKMIKTTYSTDEEASTKIQQWYRFWVKKQIEFKEQLRKTRLYNPQNSRRSVVNKSNKTEIEKQEQYEKIVQQMKQSSDSILQVLKEKIAKSDVSLDKVFKSFDINDDGFISLLEFKKVFRQAQIDVPEKILIETYEKFDVNNDEKVSYIKFLNVLLDDKQSQVFKYLKEAEDVLSQIRKLVKGKYGTLREFLDYFQSEDNIEYSEYIKFVDEISSSTFSSIQLKNVFMMITQDTQQELNTNITLQTATKKQISELYQHEVKKVQISTEVMNEQIQGEKEKQFEKLREQQKIENEIDEQKQQAEQIFQSQQKQNVQAYKSQADQKVVSIFSGPKQDDENMSRERRLEAQKRTQIYKQELDNVQKVLKEISNQVNQKIKTQNKDLRDLFNLFAKNQFGYVDIEEFLLMMNFVLQYKSSENDEPSKFSKPKSKKLKITDDVIKSIFFVFSNDFTHRMSYNLFEHLIKEGENINCLYLKFKQRFGSTLEKNQDAIEEDFQRMDIQRGDGFIKLSDLKEVCENNEILFTDEDAQSLSEQGLVKKIGSVLYINYKQLLPLIFPVNIQIQQTIFTKQARIILRLFRRFKERKQREKNNENQQNLTTSKKQKKVSIMEHPKEKTSFQIIGDTMKAQDLDNLLDSTPSQKSKRTQSNTSLQKQLNNTKTKRGSQASQKKDIHSQLSSVIPKSQQNDKFVSEKRNVVETFCKQIIMEVLDQVHVHGESVQLSKQVQKKFENRPVQKNVYITLQDFQCDIQDILPKSLYTSEKTGRILFVDGSNYLHQYDFVNNKKLKNIYIGSKVPLKRTKILDTAYDDNSGRFYVLNDKWIVEVWEIGQGQSIPLQRLRLFSEDYPTSQIIDACYQRRFHNTTPNFLVLSEATKSQLIVNCTCINNSIVFIDPISLSIYNTIYFSSSDYKMSSNLTKLINIMAPKLQDLAAQDMGFEKIFQGKIKQTNEGSVVHKDDFTIMLKSIFGTNAPDVTLDEWEEITEFLDQNNSGYIDQVEYEFLSEMFKFVQNPDNDSQQNMHKLSGMSETAFKLLNELGDYLKAMKLSINDAFSIFDTDGSGQISVHEFLQILNRVSGSDHNDEKHELIEFIDKDGNGTIDIDEFSEIFGVANNPDNSKNFSANNRKNLMLCFSKCFAGGINIEQIILNEDPHQEGFIKATNFRNILRWLPLGLLDEEIDHIMNSQVIYTDSGCVDYLQFVNNMQFKEMKFAYKIKKSMLNDKDFDKFHDAIDEDKRSGVLQKQKVILESVIFLDELDLIIYTTLCPKTSLIFVASSKKNNDLNSKSQNKKQQTKGKQDTDIFQSKLLAKLTGHITTNAPTIFYCKESGFLISAEKADKQKGYKPKKVQQTGKKEAFSSFYQNIEDGNSKNATNILVWDLQKTLQGLYDSNPPWTIEPSKIICDAHNDTIIDISYLPYSQLIVTASIDKTIKLWDPTSRPYALNSGESQPKMIKPGYYAKGSDNQQTVTNQSFCLVRTIYTGTAICYSLQSLLKKVPMDISNMQQNQLNTQKHFAILELFICMNLENPTLVQGTYKTAGFIKGYSMDKMNIEIPGRLHDEIIPKKYQDQLERISIERKQKMYVNYQLSLPVQLESLKSNNRVQQSGVNNCLSNIKALNLFKYKNENPQQPTEEELEEEQQEKYDFEKNCDQLFDLFLSLPNRKHFKALLGAASNKQLLTANEIFYYFKKFHAIHPLNLSKNSFFEEINKLKYNKQLSQVLLNPLETKLGDLLQNQGIVIHQLFEETESSITIPAQNITPEDIKISIADFKKILENLKIFTNEEDFVQLITKIDPLFSNQVSANDLEIMFSQQILINKLNNLSKPEELIKQIMGNLTPQEKTILMQEFTEADKSYPGFLLLEEFKSSFVKANIQTDSRLLDQIFESIAEKLHPDDKQKVLSIKQISKKFFDPAETVGLARYMHIIGKIKRALIDRGLQVDQPFIDQSQGTNVSSTRSVPFSEISVKQFKENIEKLNLPTLSQKELIDVAKFLSVSTGTPDSSTIKLQKFQHYIRKLNIKDTYIIAQDYQNLFNEITRILDKQKEFKNISKQKFGRKDLDMSEIRYVLSILDTPSDSIDNILIKFVQEDFISPNQFLDNLFEFQENFEGLAPKKIKLPDQTDINQSQQITEKKEKDPQQQNLLASLLVGDQKEAEVEKEMFIKNNKYTEELVNYIRQNDPLSIPKLKIMWQNQDLEKLSELDLIIFSNIIKNNVKGITDQMIINFQKEVEFYTNSNRIDYTEFYTKYLGDNSQLNNLNNDNLLDVKIQKDETTTSKIINNLIQQISEKIHQNLTFVVKFYSDSEGQIDTQEIIEYLVKMKIKFNQEETEKFQEFFQSKKYQHKIDGNKFMTSVYASSKNLATAYDSTTWMITAKDIGIDTLDLTQYNIDLIKFTIKQRSNTNQGNLRLPLIQAKSLQDSLMAIKDFKGKQIEQILNYAIVGCAKTQEQGFQILTDLEKNQDISNYIINLDLFEESLQKTIAILEQQQKDGYKNNKSSLQTQTQSKLNEKQSEELQYLIAQINGNLKDRGITMWDALLSADVRITQDTTVPVREFKLILNSLNMKLSMKQKLMLIRLADLDNSGKCDLEIFIKNFETTSSLSNKSIQIILEKFSTALFYNDMTIGQAFDIFDIDKDGQISKNEFIYGMQQLDFGLSIFEINQIMESIDGDKSKSISKKEFNNAINQQNMDYGIDSLKYFSLSLLTKIKNIITIKGQDLLQSLQEIDHTNKGYLSYEEMKAGMRLFGLHNIQNHQALTLFKIYKNNKKNQQNLDNIDNQDYDLKDIATEKIQINIFVRKILEAVNIHAKSAIETNNQLLRKIFKMVQLKNISIFEAFLYMDINSSGSLSKLELNIGLKNLDIPLSELDFQQFWNIFDKTKKNRIKFTTFFQKFVQSGSIDLIKFEDSLEILFKRFSDITYKFGNYSEAFTKFDTQNNGTVSLSEFKTVNKKQQLGFTTQECEKIFKALINADSLQRNKQFNSGLGQEENEDSYNKSQDKTFSYRQFVKLVSQFSRRSAADQAFYKLGKSTAELQFDWKQEIINHNKKYDDKTKDKNSIFIKNFQDLLQKSKFSITGEDISEIINSYDSIYVNAQQILKSIQNATNKLNGKEKEKSTMVHGLILRIQQSMAKQQIQIDSLFQKFDENQNGTISLKELTQMIQYLNIDINKNQTKSLFTTLDQDSKGYCTINEFKNLLEESSFIRSDNSGNQSGKSSKQRMEGAKLTEICNQIKSNLQSRNLTLISIMETLNFNEQTVLNQKNLDKVLFTIGITLSKNDIEFLQHKVNESDNNNINNPITFQQFQDFAIRQNIESIQYDESVNYVHPTVAVYIEKISNIFKRLEIDTKQGFNYFVKDGRTHVSKKEFIKILQSLDLNLSKDDIWLIYTYFDDKNNGEITQEQFIEKFDYLVELGLNKLKQQNNQQIQDKDEDEQAQQELKMIKLSSKAQVQTILQKIFIFMQEKRYSKKQMKALFDKNGNGILSREEFMETVMYLQLEIPLIKIRMVMDYLDIDNLGEIKVDELIKMIFGSLPSSYKKMHTYTGVVKIINNIVQILKQDTKLLLDNLVQEEQWVKPKEITVQQNFFKAKSGILILEFFKQMKKQGIKLAENEKEEMKQIFLLQINNDYLDLEAIYDLIYQIYNERMNNNINNEKLLETENQNLLWEQKVYRNIGNYLKSKNLSVADAFKHIDQDQSGNISLKEFKLFIESCNLKLSDKEINQLVNSYQNSDNVISIQAFKDKFWEAYTCFGRENGIEQAQKQTLDQLVEQKKKILQYVFMSLRDISSNSLEKAWSLLDIRKIGYFNIEDYRKALVQIGIYLSQKELSFSFTFINKSKNNQVNFFELADFWLSGQNNLLSMENLLVQQTNKNDMQAQEQEILEHVSKLINQREITLQESFNEIDKEGKGFLNIDQFGEFLQRLGLDLKNNQDQLQQLIDLIDPKSDGQLVHLTALESRLKGYNLNIKYESVFDRVQWKDRPLMKLVCALQEVLEGQQTISQFFESFDKDYDGQLSQIEFYNAIKQITQDYKIEDYQLQRLTHKLILQKDGTNKPYINIEYITKYLEAQILEMETLQVDYQNKEDMYQQYILIDKVTFRQIVSQFDAFQQMLQGVTDIKLSFISVKKYMNEKLRNFRGFKLASQQNAFKDIIHEFDDLSQCLQHSLQYIRNNSQSFINNQVTVKYIEPEINNFLLDQETLRQSYLELEKSEGKYINDPTEYHIESKTLEYITPFVKKLYGEHVRSNQLVEVYQYDKNTLQQIGQDGVLFEKHLLDELKLHNALQKKHYQDSFMFKNIGFYEKRIGIDTSDKQIYVINEMIDPNQYVSLSELIYNNGGLLRVPFLTKTNAVTYLVKYWGRQILTIINEVHTLGGVLNILRPENLYVSMDGQKIKLSSVRGSGRVNRFARHETSPDFKINLIPEHGPLKAIDEQSFDNYDVENYQKYMNLQPYLSPEQISKNIQELNPYVDVWTFGCLLYELMFGQPPKSYDQQMQNFSKSKIGNSEPCEYFHYDLYNDELVQDILKNDYNIVLDQNINSNMERSIERKTFGGIFKQIFKEIKGAHQLGFQELGEILDIISCCLEYFPYKRPTIKGLLHSKLFQQEEYKQENAKQFSECMFFYKSPSVTIGERVFKPLRILCSQSLDNTLQYDTFDVTNDILGIMDIVRDSVINQTSKALEQLQKSAKSEVLQQSQLFRLKQGMPLIMQDKLQATEKARQKLSNNVLIKFIFDNDIIDMLVFLVLRYHKFMTQKENKLVKNINITKAETNNKFYNNAREKSVRILTSLKDIFQQLIFQLDSYISSVSPYVSKVIENLVKFFLGEEYKLASDIIDILNINAGFVPFKNTYKEYTKNEEKLEKEHEFCKDFYNKFFSRNIDQQNPDIADIKWKNLNPVSQRPYIFLSKNWTPVLYNVIGTLFKDTISEAGIGKGTYPVIQDYIRFCSEKQEINEFDLNNKVKKLNQKIRRQLPRTADYYNDLIMMAENLCIIYDNNNISNSSIRIVLSYFKSMLLSNNTDKIKLLIDSKAPVYLIPFLNTDNSHVRGELLEIFYEISNGFKAVQYSYMQKNLKKSDEINKNLGIVAHINQVSEDKIDRERFLDCANDYYYLKKQINTAYLYQTAFVFETPNLIQNLFYTMKSTSELIQNKIILIKIFSNLITAPQSIVQLLQSGTIDLFNSIFRFLIKPKPGMPQNDMKINKILGPIVTDVFRQIQRDSRNEIIDIFEQTPKIRVMLREQGFEMPERLNLTKLQYKFEDVQLFYEQEKRQIILEIKSQILSARQTNFLQSAKTPATQEFYIRLQDAFQHTLSWFKNYKNEQQNINISSDNIKVISQSLLDLGKQIVDDLQPYAQVHQGCELIVSEVIDFIEIMINMDLTEMIFDYEDNISQAVKSIVWMQDLIKKITKYHEKMGQEDDNEIKEKDRLRQTKITFMENGEEKDQNQLNIIMDHESVRKFTQNKLNKVSHSIMRILMKLTELDSEKAYEMINKSSFGNFFIKLIKKQYLILQNCIKLKTEKLHVMQNYVEEANFRVKTFENILQGENHDLKQFLITQGFLNNVCGQYFTDEHNFDVGQVRTTMTFLPFRDFLPLRNESLALMTAIIWHRENSEGMYKELLLQISHYNLIKREYESLNKYDQRNLIFLSSLYFFTLLANSNDQQLIFLMKHERVNAFMHEFFSKNPEFIKYYPSLYNISNGQGSFDIK